MLALGVALLGSPVQVALGAMIAMRRQIPLIVAMFLPLVCLAFGVLGVFEALSDAKAALRSLPDPGYAPFFALHDRAAALAPLVIGGLSAAGLSFVVAAGAAFAAVREQERSLLGLTVAMPASAVAALLGVIGFVAGAHPWWALPFAGFGLAAFGVVTAVSLTNARPRSLAGPGSGVAAFVVGALGLCAAAIAAVECELADVFRTFDQPWAGVAQIAANTPATGRAQALALVATMVALVGVLPGLLVVRARRLDVRAGADLAAFAGAVLVLLLSALGVVVQRVELGRLAGAYPLTVLRAGALFDVPRVEPVPPRVLVMETASPRWITMREGGGADVSPVTVPAEELGPTIRLGDGLILPPRMSAEELYLMLLGSDAGKIALVGCAAGTVEEPLIAAGRCSAVPLLMRVTDILDDPRTFIVLRDHFLDDGGNVISVPELTDVAGRDVILRLQADATVADVVVVLRALTSARRVYLGWGVDLAGEDLPIGVNPDLRVRALKEG